MAKRVKLDRSEAGFPISSMIDIVFLLIIFFVVTASIDKEIEDEAIILSNAPHGKPLTKKPLKCVTINVRRNGTYNVNGQLANKAAVSNILRGAAQDWGNDVPIIIRGDSNAPHGYIQEVLEAINDTGLYKVKFMAVVVPDKG